KRIGKTDIDKYTDGELREKGKNQLTQLEAFMYGEMVKKIRAVGKTAKDDRYYDFFLENLHVLNTVERAIDESREIEGEIPQGVQEKIVSALQAFISDWEKMVSEVEEKDKQDKDRKIKEVETTLDSTLTYME